MAKNDTPPDEMFERDGMRVERRGKMTYIHNTRTKEEHQAFLDGLPSSIENMDASIKEGTEAVIAYFQSFDNVVLLGGLAMNHYYHQTDRDDDGMAEVILEYAINISTAFPYEKKTLPEWQDIYDLITNLKNLRTVYHSRAIAESVNSHQLRPAESHLIELRFRSVIEAISIRGNGYYVHVRELFLELFSGHDEFLLKHYGFTASDILNTEEELEKAFKARLAINPSMPNPVLMMTFADWAFSNRRLPMMNASNLADFHHDNPEYLIENGRIITYSGDTIEDLEPLFRVRFTNDVQEKVVGALSMMFGENAAYIVAPSNGHLLADTLTKTKPFLKTEANNYYQFALPLLNRNFLTIGQYLLENAPKDNKKYYNKYYQNKQHAGSRDRFLEDKVEKIFRAFLPTVQFTPNVAYPLPDQPSDKTVIEYTELDLLGIGSSHIYLIEVKAGELNAAGKRGGIESLVNRLKRNVSEGDYQSNRAQNYIQDNDRPVFKKDKTDIVINKTKSIIRIVVTLDTFAGLLVEATVLENANLINSKNGYPWVVNIYDLMIFAEIIESEEDFIDYLNLRLDLNRWKEFSTGDEVNLLGHFLSDQLQFEDRHRELDNFSLNNYLREIDAYFYSRQNGLPAKKPKRKK